MPNENNEVKNPIGLILDQILAAKKTVDTPWDKVDFRMREGFGIARNNAEEMVQKLTNDIRKLSIPTRLIGLYVTGTAENLAALRKLMETEGGLAINANKIYNDIAKDLEITYGSDRLMKIHTFMQLVTLYRNLAEDFDTINCPPLNYKEVECPTIKDTANYVKKQIRGALGDELTVKVLTKDIVDGIIKHGLEGKYIPIMVTDASDDDKRLFLNKFFTKTINLNLTETTEVTKESISKTIKEALTQ